MKALIPTRFPLTWLLALPAVACGGSSPGHRTDASSPAVTFSVDLSPAPQLDMVFMIDNSGMAPKVTKMTTQFPSMLQALKDPARGTYPDLRIAIIDSDLGTGGAYPNGSCAPNASNGYSQWGDQGKFQMRNKNADGTTCGVDPDALWIEYSKGQPVNYDLNKDISQVFECLAANLGTAGCGEEQPLQAFEFALVTPGLGNEEQRKMLRPYAQLALVFITDEDDCSAAPDDGMFGDKPELAGESASLRCATRAHACGGANLTSAPPGYPTTAPFSAPFVSCKARMDACPNPTDGTASDVVNTSGPTECSPLKSIKVMADEMKALKPLPDQQLLVAGIFGWPRVGTDGTPDLANAVYRIDLVPNPNGADTDHPQIFDYWPVCYDPNHMPKSGNDSNGNSKFDADAWGLGAAGGLRLAAFLDEFGKSGLKFSICESDFSATMTTIGSTLARRMTSSCLPAAVGQFAHCTGHLLIPDGAGGYVMQPDPVPSCDAAPAATLCYTLTADQTACDADEYRVEVSSASSIGESTVLQLECK